mgnify:CR=1 FL=1
MNRATTANWNKQRYFDDVAIGDELPSITIPITLQRLVMEAGANRDLSLIHHDNDVAKATGAPGAYANTFFLMGMFERLLREWMGLQGKLKKISSLRMATFNAAGDLLRFHGTVKQQLDNKCVVLDLCAKSDRGITVTAEATVELPRRSV